MEAHPDLRGLDRVDRDLYRRDGALAWFRIDDFPDLHLRFTWTGHELAVVGHYYHRLSKTAGRDWLRRVVYHRSLPNLRRRRFTTLLYYLVYYPCFWWLEHERDLPSDPRRRRASAERRRGDGRPERRRQVDARRRPRLRSAARLLSDTFLLHKGAVVRSVPEPLLLDQWSRGWLGGGASALQPIRHRYCAQPQRLPLARRSVGRRRRRPPAGVPATRDVALRVAIVSQPGAGRIRAGDLIVNDVRRYWAFASVLEVLDPNPLVHAREQSLAELVNTVPAFEVGLTADVPRAEMVGLIDHLLATAEPLSHSRLASRRGRVSASASRLAASLSHNCWERG